VLHANDPGKRLTMTNAISPQATQALHRSYKMALLPVALVALERGEITDLRVPLNTESQRRNHASGVAHMAATDLVLTGKTVWFPMADVAEVLPEFAAEATREIAKANQRSELYSSIIGRRAA
jgi:hypothetical protein